MSNRFVITQTPLESISGNKDSYLVTATFQEDKMTEVSCRKYGEQTNVGNIYAARVKDVVKNINAAFLQIENGEVCYLSLEDVHHPIYTKKCNSPKLCQGDELLIQIAKEPMKTKAAVATTNINLPGKLVVLTTGNRSVGISAKIKGERRNCLKNLAETVKPENFGLVIRTNCATAKDEDILCEIERLTSKLDSIVKRGQHALCGTCIFREESSYLAKIRSLNDLAQFEIMTDLPSVYDEIKTYMEESGLFSSTTLTLYRDDSYPLSKLLSLEVKIKSALSAKVWLKSGAYLVIQPTEALWVIDVNSGKNSKKKNVQENFLNINLEAAKEIARQIRLRNISGICIVDFIDMPDPEYRAQLTRCLEEELAKDPIPASLVDFTRLNLAEITRKKVDKPLHEQIGNIFIKSIDESEETC